MRAIAHVLCAFMSLVVYQSSASGQDYLNSPYQSPQFKYQEQQRDRERDEFYNRQREQNQNQQLERRRSNSYGAIAYSSESGEIGYSEKFANRAQAEQRAKQECGKSDCEIAAWFYYSCGALAAGDDGAWGSGQGGNEQRARQGAIARCVKEDGKNCKVIAAQCSW